ncbi:MAG: MFS transporter [Myxococcota bacterium]
MGAGPGDPTSEGPGDPSARPVSRAYANYVLGVLLLVYVMNFVDRQVLAILLEDIKRDLQVSDTALGLLSGLAFALFYTLAGIPIARWADRGSRRLIISLGLAVWSGMTALSGLTQSFAQLALARVGVGVGEAAGSPPSHSLISDYFPPERRATALSIYAMGIYLGVMLGYLAGGWLNQAFDWRTAFIVVGLPGIPLALLVRFTVREPPRGLSEHGPVDTRSLELAEVARFLLARRSFVLLVLAASCQSLTGYAMLAWGPAFLGRVHGMQSGEIGLWVGLITGLGGGLGAYLGGRLTDHLAKRDVRWALWLPAIVSVAGVPFAIPFLLLDDRTLALAAFAPFYLLGAMYVGPLWSVPQNLVKVRMRALASALLLFILNLVGLGLGPLVVGFLNDLLAPRFGAEAIRYSLLSVSLMGGLAGLFFWLGARSYPRDLASRDA